MLLPRAVLIGAVALLLPPTAFTSERKLSPQAERGKKSLETRTFSSAAWTLDAYDKVWRHWGVKERPADYAKAFRERYGLHPAPFDNGKYPMGLREGSRLFTKGIATDCLLCHGGSILGKSYVGLGNSTLDIEALFEEMGKASGGSGKLPFTYSNVRGTSEAAGFAIFLLAHRQPDLKIRLRPLDLDVKDYLCEDVPAWWLLKKKKTMYFTGATPATSVRSIMQFMLASTSGPADFAKEEATFRDIRAYLLTLEAPPYPFAIDRALAAKGEQIFRRDCAKCHGTYGKDWTYPNKIIPLDEIGTDPARFHGISEKWGHYYNDSWFAKEGDGTEGRVRPTKGYQAPPLDGVWATAPYFHNGCAPTLYHVLNSKARPRIFTRSYKTDEASYDKVNVGWKFDVLDSGATREMSPYERRKIYDTRQPGRSNTGHTFGDHLSEPERRAVVEYLKTL